MFTTFLCQTIVRAVRGKNNHEMKSVSHFLRVFLEQHLHSQAETLYLLRHPELVRKLMESSRWAHEGKRGRALHDVDHDLEH